MKKIMMRKISTALLVAAMFGGGVFAQVADTAYSAYDANTTVPTNIDFITLNSGGTVVGYYAMPDSVYHPNYNAASSWALTADFTWDWTIPTNPSSGATVTSSGTPANYVEITYTATGDYVVNVAEQAPAAFGGCSDATPTAMNVTVIDAPEATITTSDPAQACGNQSAMAVVIQFDEDVPDTLAAYAFAVQELVVHLNADGSVNDTVSNSLTYEDFPTNGKLKTGTTGWSVVTAGSQYGFQFNTSALNVDDGQRTSYTYRLVEPSDLSTGSDGVVSAISEKSDYINGSVRTHAFTDSELVVVVNPAPNTGPIYHISNTYAY